MRIRRIRIFFVDNEIADMTYWLTGWETQGISVDLTLHTNGGESINIPAENNVLIAQNAVAGDTIIITLNSTTSQNMNEVILQQTSNITEGQVNIILYNISEKNIQVI